MWYEVIPSGVITFGLISATCVVPPFIAWICRSNRKYTPRYFHGHEIDYQMYIRDIYKFGSMYKPQGLEALDNVTEQ